MKSVSYLSSVSNCACSNLANDEQAVVLACTSLVFCALDLHQSQEQLQEKVRWACPPMQCTLWRRAWTRVVRVAPVALVMTSVLRRAVRQARQVCRHVTSRRFPNPHAKTNGLDSVSRGDVTNQVEFGLYRMYRRCWNLEADKFLNVSPEYCI